MSFAPILVTVYNRYQHFINCIESLKKNIQSKDSHLFISIDAPSKEEDVKINKSIINYSKSIGGFKDITILVREKNYGSFLNRHHARNEIFNIYSELIEFEDDNIFSIDFLSYINNGLETYRNREDVFSISAYNYPIKIPSHYDHNVYAWSGFSGWGYGIWKEKWEKINWSRKSVFKIIKNFLSDSNEVTKFNKIAEHYVPALILMLKEGEIHGDGYICLYQYINNMCSIFPTVSRVLNTGHDGTGENCKITNKYKNQVIYSDVKKYDLYKDITPNQQINNILRQYFKINSLTKINSSIELKLIKEGLINLTYVQDFLANLISSRKMTDSI